MAAWLALLDGEVLGAGCVGELGRGKVAAAIWLAPALDPRAALQAVGDAEPVFDLPRLRDVDQKPLAASAAHDAFAAGLAASP